jgi:hypothetical protein
MTMNAFLIDTRGRRPVAHTLVLIPGPIQPGILQSLRGDTLNDPLALITRLHAIEIVIASPSERDQIEAMANQGNIDAFMLWLEHGLHAGRVAESHTPSTVYGTGQTGAA